jgi:hypothetical protein
MEHVHHHRQNRNGTFSGAKSQVRTVQRPRPGPGRKKKNRRAEGKLVMYRHIHKIDKVVRMLRTVGSISSTAGGIIAFFNSGIAGVTASPDWTNFSQEYANYRVRKFTMRFFPATTSSTVTTGPYQSIMAMSRFWGLVPTSQSSMFQDMDVIFISTLQEGQMSNNFLGYMDAQEWTPVGTAIATERNYGVSGISPANSALLAVSSVIFTYVLEYETEFLDAY